jgi:hypothetical protein
MLTVVLRVKDVWVVHHARASQRAYRWALRVPLGRCHRAVPLLICGPLALLWVAWLDYWAHCQSIWAQEDMAAAGVA